MYLLGNGSIVKVLSMPGISTYKVVRFESYDMYFIYLIRLGGY